ncbi:hypothetical protein ACYFX5_09045 [Bremerella sp. T1]|uniref:hypothetical protein n=1 Tax=Bremerella sp. TYQ1 TaxID=3119568 RepID=UPI001CCE6FB2|nr:hypothetical protein [Bremerella volcania]UBM38398.1 hypothetical protein LA756_10975 [Bremerella volcania]
MFYALILKECLVQESFETIVGFELKTNEGYSSVLLNQQDDCVEIHVSQIDRLIELLKSAKSELSSN